MRTLSMAGVQLTAGITRWLLLPRCRCGVALLGRRGAVVAAAAAADAAPESGGAGLLLCLVALPSRRGRS